MALTARTIDVTDENVPFVVTFKSPFNAGAKLYIHYSVDGVMQPEKELAGASGAQPSVQFDVPEGAEIEYQVIERAAGQPDHIRGRKKKEIAGASPSASPSAAPASPSHAPGAASGAPAASAADPDKNVKEFSAKLLAALHNPDTSAENILAIFEELELEMQQRLELEMKQRPELEMKQWLRDVQKRLLASLSVALGNLASLAPAVRNNFKGKSPCTTIDEFMDRFELGSDQFRHRVYLKMKADPEAAKAFNIKPGAFDPEDPFGSNRLNRIFDHVCFKHDLGGRPSAARIGAALKTISPVAPTDPEGDKERMDLLKPVLERRELKKPGLFGKLRANKLDNLLHAAVQAGGLLTAISGGGLLLGAGIALTPSLLEALVGVRSRDVIKAMQNPSKLQGIKDLWGTFAKNFALFDWIKSDKNALQVLSERVAHVFRNAVPVVGPLGLRRNVSIGGYEDTGEVVGTAEKRDRELAALVEKFASGEVSGASSGLAAPGAPAATPPASPAAPAVRH